MSGADISKFHGLAKTGDTDKFVGIIKQMASNPPSVALGIAVGTILGLVGQDDSKLKEWLSSVAVNGVKCIEAIASKLADTFRTVKELFEYMVQAVRDWCKRRKE